MNKKTKTTFQNEENNKSHATKLSDIILGGQDGLVNTLGVILGASAASGNFRIVVATGLAASIAEAISMGAVAYTSNVAARDYYQSQINKEKREIKEFPELEIEEIREIYRQKGLKGDLLEKVVKVITSDEKVWLQTMMQEELKLAPIENQRPLIAGLWVGLSAMLGSLVPLTPFFIFYWFFKIPTNESEISQLIWTSIYAAIGISSIVLFAVGAIKSKITIGTWYKSGLQMATIGIISALAGFGIALLFAIE